MQDKNLNKLIINKLTKAQYDEALAAGTINENELYMTTDNEDIIFSETEATVGSKEARSVKVGEQEWKFAAGSDFNPDNYYDKGTTQGKLDLKLDKIAEQEKVYATNGLGDQTSLQYNTDPVGGGLVRRTNGGQVKATAAVENNDAIIKETFDAAIQDLEHDKLSVFRYTLSGNEITQSDALAIINAYSNYEGQLIEFLTNGENPNKTVAYGYVLSNTEGDQFLIVNDNNGRTRRWNKTSFDEANVKFKMNVGQTDCDIFTIDTPGEAPMIIGGLEKAYNKPEGSGFYGTMQVIFYNSQRQIQIYYDTDNGASWTRIINGTADNHSFSTWQKTGLDQAALDAKQDKLISGTNIKTVNDQDLLGAGNVNIACEDMIFSDTAVPGAPLLRNIHIGNKDWSLNTEGTTVPPATKDTLGVIKVGNNLSITEDGILTANLEDYYNKAAADSAMDTKLANYYDKTATDKQINDKFNTLIDTAPETLDTLNELAAALGDNPNFAADIAAEIGKKANTADVYPKTETYTQIEVNNKIDEKIAAIPPVDISGKQDKLVSGTNIKTINDQPILGEGNLNVACEDMVFSDTPVEGATPLANLAVGGQNWSFGGGAAGGGIVPVNSLPEATQEEYEKHILYLNNGLYYIDNSKFSKYSNSSIFNINNSSTWFQSSVSDGEKIYIHFSANTCGIYNKASTSTTIYTSNVSNNFKLGILKNNLYGITNTNIYTVNKNNFSMQELNPSKDSNYSSEILNKAYEYNNFLYIITNKGSIYKYNSEKNSIELVVKNTFDIYDVLKDKNILYFMPKNIIKQPIKKVNLDDNSIIDLELISSDLGIKDLVCYAGGGIFAGHMYIAGGRIDLGNSNNATTNKIFEVNLTDMSLIEVGTLPQNGYSSYPSFNTSCYDNDGIYVIDFHYQPSNNDVQHGGVRINFIVSEGLKYYKITAIKE